MSSGVNTTVLSNAQASQLIEKLRNSSGTIKIQAIQTNPQTGAKQIVAIPINTSNSPLKLITTTATPTSSTAGGITISRSGASGGGGGGGGSGQQQQQQQQQQQTVKLVKISSSNAPSTSQNKVYNIVQQQPQHQHQQQQQQQQQQQPHQQQQQLQQVIVMQGQQNNHPIQQQQQQQQRKRTDIDFDAFSDAKRRKTEKGGKGLRHFSMKVCEKVQAKGSTSYNEVADELVSELTDPRCTSPTDQQYDQKNIRRRVYDALNVLMAMNIISKEKKEIRWLGLPTNSIQEANALEQDKIKRMDRIRAKTHQLQDLILQQIAFKNLVERNKQREKDKGVPPPNSAIQLPFITVSTSKKTVIDCSISNDKMEYLFNFDDTFEIHDDMEVLKRMGLSFGLEGGNVKEEDLAKARSMVPRALEQYVIQLAENGPGSCSGMPEVTAPINRHVPDSDNDTLRNSESDSDVEVN